MKTITNYTERIETLELTVSELQVNLTQAMDYITKMKTGMTWSITCYFIRFRALVTSDK